MTTPRIINGEETDISGPPCWLVWGRTKAGFCELLAIGTTPEYAERMRAYIILNDSHKEQPRLVDVLPIEEREMDHALGMSMMGIGKLPRQMEDMGWRKGT